MCTMRPFDKMVVIVTSNAVRLDTNNVQILDHAAVPVVPVGPNGKLMIALGLALLKAGV